MLLVEFKSYALCEYFCDRIKDGAGDGTDEDGASGARAFVLNVAFVIVGGFESTSVSPKNRKLLCNGGGGNFFVTDDERDCSVENSASVFAIEFSC